MRAAAANRAGICGDRAELQAKAGKDAAVGVVHHAIGLFQAVEVCMEGIGIFHHEFTCAHHAKTGADFVAEFGLDLIEVYR